MAPLRGTRRCTLYTLTALCACGLIYFQLEIPLSRLDRRHERDLAVALSKCAAVENCEDRRTEKRPDAKSVISNPGSACPDAHVHGKHQRVLSFVYFGNTKPWRRFAEGVVENARLADRHYPGWRLRIYHPMPERSRWEIILKKAACCHKNVDLCPLAPPIGRIPMLWRALPLADPDVDVFVSRDLDSRLSTRERTAVEEWLAEPNKTFHIMRDFPDHISVVMGGLWGAKVSEMRKELEDTTRQILLDQTLDLTDDQMVLSYYLKPLLKDRVVQHDAYSCQNETFTELGGMRPFSTRRSSEDPNFVGALFSDPAINDECPKECRPPAGQDWKLC